LLSPTETCLRRRRAIVATVTSQQTPRRSTEISIDEHNGLDHASVVKADDLYTVRLSQLMEHLDAGRRKAPSARCGAARFTWTGVAAEHPRSAVARRQQTQRVTGIFGRMWLVPVIDDLERAGYVQRRRNPTDRRAYGIQPTGAGAESNPLADLGARLVRSARHAYFILVAEFPKAVENHADTTQRQDSRQLCFLVVSSGAGRIEETWEWCRSPFTSTPMRPSAARFYANWYSGITAGRLAKFYGWRCRRELIG
jgi:hypothetical protein